MKDGKTVREHLEMVATRDPVEGAKELARVVPVPLPPCALRSSRAFEMLSGTRKRGFGGVSPLTLGDVVTYSQHITPLSRREMGWVMTMDAACCEALAADG
jgi:hypothetical protein